MLEVDGLGPAGGVSVTRYAFVPEGPGSGHTLCEDAGTGVSSGGQVEGPLSVTVQTRQHEITPSLSTITSLCSVCLPLIATWYFPFLPIIYLSIICSLCIIYLSSLYMSIIYLSIIYHVSSVIYLCHLSSAYYLSHLSPICPSVNQSVIYLFNL